MKAFARFPKNRSLRMVNLLSLSVIFACLLLSGDYLKKEWSYDRHHLHADRMARLSLRFGDEPVDGRIYLPIDPILEQMPEIEQVVKLEKLYTAVLNIVSLRIGTELAGGYGKSGGGVKGGVKCIKNLKFTFCHAQFKLLFVLCIKNKKVMEIVKFSDVEEKVLTIRGEKVILDSDVAALYGVETKRINEAVKNNLE